MLLSECLHQVNTKYLTKYNTVLIGGFNEPFYAAPKIDSPALIQFTQDYFRSALHELAHWCIAGKERRLLNDYGYWYTPDGRNQEQQIEFYKVEVKPQAIEWAFAIICGIEFEVSMDNLGSKVYGELSFQKQVRDQLVHYINKGFPSRAMNILSLLYEASGQQDLSLENHLLSSIEQSLPL